MSRRSRFEPRFRPGASEVEALARRYARWAHEHRLADDAYRFVGRINGRDILFATGLGGSYPSAPEIVVMVNLDIAAPVLLKPTSSPEAGQVGALLREVLDVNEEIRNLGLTQRFVRITFEPGTDETAFDEALGALEERLRLLGGDGALPYRG